MGNHVEEPGIVQFGLYGRSSAVKKNVAAMMEQFVVESWARFWTSVGSLALTGRMTKDTTYPSEETWCHFEDSMFQIHKEES